MTVNKYRVTVKHDQGTIRLITAATSEEAARQIVMKAEHCPACAIVKIQKLKP